MVRRITLSFMAVLCVLFLSCSPSQEARLDPSAGKGKPPSAALDQDVTGKAGKVKPDTEKAARKIIKEGEIVFQTNDSKEAGAFLDKAVKDAGGYIASDVQDTYGGRVRNTLLIRVPAERFDALIAAITASFARIESKSIRTRDVTEEYIDLDARIRSQKDLEKKFQQLLGQARTIDEVFKINKELAEVREKIEAVEGKMKYLNDSIVYSRLTVTYYREGTPGIHFFSRLWEGIGNGWTYFAFFIIGLVNIWPFILVAALIAAGVIILIGRKRKKA